MWGVECRHTKPTSHAFSYMHEKSLVFDYNLYALGSANATKNSTSRCEENCAFFTVKGIVENAIARFEEAWEGARLVDSGALDDVERCKERRQSKSASRARSQSAIRDRTVESEDGGGASVPEHYRIGSVPPSHSCSEIGVAKRQSDSSGVSRRREHSRSGCVEAPPQSLPPATRRAGTASMRVASALATLPETRWSDARSRGRSYAHSQGS